MLRDMLAMAVDQPSHQQPSAQPTAPQPGPPPPPTAPPPPPPPPPVMGSAGAGSAGSAGSSRGARVRTVAQHPNARVIALAVLIGFASILSSVVAWQASLSSIQASRYGSLAAQQRTRTQQIEADLRGLIDQDLRFVNLYQEHSLAARELKSQADELRATDPNSADELDVESQARSDLARALKPFFLAAGNIQINDEGTVDYDVDFVLTNLEQGNVELRELRTANTKALADQADAKA